MKAFKRIVVPETSYPNEGKIELRQRAISFLDNLATGPASEQVDAVSLYHQSLYGWWAAVLKHYINIMKKDTNRDDVRIQEDLFEDINDQHRFVSTVNAPINAHSNKCPTLINAPSKT